MQAAYDFEESFFVKTVKVVFLNCALPDASIINSNALHKIMKNDDGLLILKARIGPHENENYLSCELSSECPMCSPAELSIVKSIALQKKLTLHKAKLRLVFLQTESAARDVFVCPTRQSG